jgi:pimeloyl-ACP methyl ester carboxylesterase
VTVVLVPGAWHGAWCFDRVAARLAATGVTSVALDNPSVARAPATLQDDVGTVVAVLDAIDEPVLLVGHSYGGAVVTEAGVHPNVAHVVYLAAFALDEGESVVTNELKGGENASLPEALRTEGDLITVDPARAVEFFYHDCEPAAAAAAVAKLQPMSAAAMGGTVTGVAWRGTPSTYVVCTDDRAAPVALQRSSAARVGTTVEMPTSHSPFLSRPDLVTELLVELHRELSRPTR